MVKNKQNITKAFSDRFKELQKKPEYYAELLKIEVTEAIYNLMEAKKISRADLARILDCKPPYITKLLRGTANITLDSLTKIAFVLDTKIEMRMMPITIEYDFSSSNKIIAMPCYSMETIEVKKPIEYSQAVGWG